MGGVQCGVAGNDAGAAWKDRGGVPGVEECTAGMS